MSIQQNMASDIYRMADSVHRSRDIAAFQQSLAQSIKSGAVESYVGIPVLQSLTQKLKLAQQKEAMAMAAPQGQQQQGVPIAAQVMQDAGQTDEDEQRYAGIDELRTNLPTEEDDNDDEYANGGIIAFADEGQVRDSNSDPLVERLREDDPETFQRLMQTTQTNQTRPETPVVTSATTGRNEGILLPRTPAYSSEPVDDKQYQDSIAIPPKAVSNWWDERMAKIKKANEAAAAARGQPLTSPVFPKRISEAEGAQAEMLKAEAASPGVAGLPAAQNVKIEPDRQGTGAGAGGALPPTLAAAEKSNSAAAARAVSAADKYMAMLEKNGESVGREKKEAFYMALISGGLAAAGGTSPNALANIAAGMVPATQQYQKVIAGIRKDDRERLEKLMGAGLKKDEFALKAEEIGINRQKAKDWYEVMMDRNNAMRSRGGDSDLKLQAEVRKTEQMYGGLIGKEQTGFDNYLKANQIYDRIDPTNVPPSLKKGYDNYARKVEGYQNRIDNLHQQKNRRIERVTGETYSEEPSSSGKVPTIANQTEYDKLPKGTQYKDPNGVLRTKG